MSALEFGQEMEQALTANPFLEENSEVPPAAEAAAEPHVETTTEPRMDPEIDMRVPQEGGAGGPEGPGGAAPGGDGSGKNEDVVDAEFTEVDDDKNNKKSA